ncbi:helix-turn-helix domain-containing protein [Actinobacillus genomosp. 2]|uniref:helix-turn-helix domain-containing protein n=1 Tax=Actinobacillus genomosp. 2 TaxID=230709 RepID=UPI002442EB83|nr:helix-turn-helix transcriptional regulator [Actinobacillus genomosp. 2]WGE32769.1 helix-turn-helix domain-containing protein [Actinobacillus genomosp. 2]
MGNLRLSIHSEEHLWLRELFLKRRQELELTQRTLGEKMGVLYSFIGKVETGDRRLDIFEFIAYCKGLELDPVEVLIEIEQKFGCASVKNK